MTRTVTEQEHALSKRGDSSRHEFMAAGRFGTGTKETAEGPLGTAQWGAPSS